MIKLTTLNQCITSFLSWGEDHLSVQFWMSLMHLKLFLLNGKQCVNTF